MRCFCCVSLVGMFKLSKIRYWPSEQLPPLRHRHSKELVSVPAHDKFDDQKQRVYNVLVLLNEHSKPNEDVHSIRTSI